jgi:hypothetical protein
MFLFWLILGMTMLLMGIFNKKLLRALHLQPMSEVFTTPELKRASRRVEQVARWLVILLGLGFLVQGLGSALPEALAQLISSVLFGLSTLLLFAMFGFALVRRKPG